MRKCEEANASHHAKFHGTFKSVERTCVLHERHPKIENLEIFARWDWRLMRDDVCVAGEDRNIQMKRTSDVIEGCRTRNISLSRLIGLHV
jgi:hypothetical protein